MSEWFEEDTTMLFIGDSITDCGASPNVSNTSALRKVITVRILVVPR